MKHFYGKMSKLLILFFGCILGIIFTFLSIALLVDVLVWMLTGAFDFKKGDLIKIIKIGCVIGTFTGAVFVTARLCKLKGF